MRDKMFRRLAAVFLAVAMTVTMLPSVPGGLVKAEDQIEYINNFEDLYDAASISRTEAGSKRTYMLANDISITEENITWLKQKEIHYISFGSSDYPFAGIFDGNGYTISGLKYEEVLEKPIADTGLFSQTKGATIKNLTIKNADIDADMRGGIVVGYAENTTIENVKVEQSALSVAPADNVLLIGTDLGIRGGGIAGETVNSVLYNCEVNNCWIRSNNTAGVAALAGKPLTLGGIVGCAESSTIEYCRVISDNPYDADGQAGVDKTLIKVYYDVAVGAVGGNTLYVGGVAGRIWSGDNDDENKGKGTQVIDCFSTAEMNFYCATYVSVLGVNIGHIGGITGEVWDENCRITRCHYAGKATSTQWNTLIAIPIIQHNVNISGVADIYRPGGDKANDTSENRIYGAFFKESLNPDVDMSTIKTSLSYNISPNGNYGPWSDSLYTNRAAWEEYGFDFSGTVDRTSDYNSGEIHHNKWVMDYELGIPVHGNSVAATFDFPGAGTVSINATGLVGTSVSTEDPYSFAVQGVTASDTSVSFTYISTDENYKLDGWWRIPDITEDTATQSHSYFTKLYDKFGQLDNVPVYGKDETGTTENPVSTENSYTAANTIDQVVQWEDNDLFVARIKALVQFHNIKKEAIDTDGKTQDSPTAADWYYFEDKLPQVIPETKPASENAVLLGWTTDKTKEYSAITSSELESLKANGQFYETGDLIKKPMDLYPVYADLISNVVTIFEGNEQDDSSDTSLRTGAGATSSKMNDDGSVTISVTGTETDGAFPDGYRFLGWYENGFRISTKQEYTFAGVDLTQKHEYTARFEYRVDYMVKCAFSNNSEYSGENGKKFAEIWHTYEEEFQNIKGINFFREAFDHWVTDKYQGNAEIKNPLPHIVTPITVYSYNLNTAGGDEHIYDVDGVVDFPGAGKIVMTGLVTSYNIKPSSDDEKSLANLGYQFIAWSWESQPNSDLHKSYGTKEKYDNNFWLDTIHKFCYTGHFAAEVNFYDKNKNPFDSDETLDGANPFLRRYETSVFAADDYRYRYEYSDTEIMDEAMHFTSPAAPTDESMKQDGYYFLGWVDKNALSDEEWNHIYDVADDSCCTSSLAKATPYLIPDDAKVYGPMELYPVYAKYNYIFTTNLEKSGFTETDTFNVPKPADDIEENVTFNELTDENDELTGKAELTFKVDNATPIMKNGGSDVYEVMSVQCIVTAEGEESTILLEPDANGRYSVEIQAGYSYEIIANYDPVPVVYHLGGETADADEKKVDLVNIGNRLGVSPKPKNTADVVGADCIFVGWTTDKPADGNYHKVSDISALPLVSENTAVQQPMELWPVYKTVSVIVNSNIDNEGEANEHRGYTITDVNNGTVKLWADPEVGDYSFTGWYTGYDAQNPENAVLLSLDAEYFLTDKNAFDGSVTYTAVYEETYRVTYHNTDGDVIYTAYVGKNDNRTFVQEVEMDNPDDEKDPEKIKVTVPVDTEAFTKIMSDVPVNEQFVEWQWVSDDGTAKRWSEFYNLNITSNMDLYPVTNAVDVKDTAQKSLSYEETGDTAKEVSLGLRKETDEDGNETDSVTVLIHTEYEQPYVDVILSEKAYKAPGVPPTETRLENEKVSLYLAHSAGDDAVDSTTLYDTKVTDNSNTHDNIGIHAHFDLYGELQLTKSLADGTTADENEVFMFTVDLGGNNVQTIPVKAGETVTIKDIPYGTLCKVSEDTNWSWRYDVDWGEYAASIDTGFTFSNYYSRDAITATNSRSNNKWMDSSSYVSNKFGTNGIEQNPDAGNGQD